MLFSSTCFAVFSLMVGTPIGANFIDDLIMTNWKSKEAKQPDPFANPFGVPFPLFEVDDPMPAFLKEEATKEIRKKEARKPKLPKPWFSISEFLTLPEMSRKTNPEGRKSESGSVGGSTPGTATPNDKITQTRDLTQTESTLNVDGAVRQKREEDHQKGENHSDSLDRELMGKELKFDTDMPDNRTAPLKKSKFSFPRGFSDVLIIFQKIGPKSKPSHSALSNNHECGEFCRNGVCEMRGPWSRGEEIEPGTLNTDEVPPEPTKAVAQHHRRGPLMGQYDRICILIIPIALAIGTLLFIIELRRIFRKMKKQTVLSTYDSQQC